MTLDVVFEVVTPRGVKLLLALCAEWTAKPRIGAGRNVRWAVWQRLRSAFGSRTLQSLGVLTSVGAASGARAS